MRSFLDEENMSHATKFIPVHKSTHLPVPPELLVLQCRTIDSDVDTPPEYFAVTLNW